MKSKLEVAASLYRTTLQHREEMERVSRNPALSPREIEAARIYHQASIASVQEHLNRMLGEKLRVHEGFGHNYINELTYTIQSREESMVVESNNQTKKRRPEQVQKEIEECEVQRATLLSNPHVRSRHHQIQFSYSQYRPEAEVVDPDSYDNGVGYYTFD